MKLRALAGSLLGAAAAACVLTGPAAAATVTVASTTGDPKLPNCFPFGQAAWGPNSGYVYKNVPAFTLAPGDKIAFDTWAVNNVDIGFDVALVATTVNGGDVPTGAFTKVVGNTQVPTAPRGNTVEGDYDIEFPSIGGFSFPGGGLIIRFSNPTATFSGDVNCTPNLVGAELPADASGFFVERFRQDADGVHPWSAIDMDMMANFRIVTTPPAPTGTGTGTGGGGGVVGPSLVDRTKPTLGGLSFSASAFRAATSGSAFSSQRKRRRSSAPTGTKVSFNLSEPGSVKFTVQRKTSGRRVKGKCKARTRANRKQPKCTLWKNVRGSFTITGTAGKNRFTFRGRIGGKSLKSGSYRLNSQATDQARNKSAIKRKAFRIVK